MNILDKEKEMVVDENVKELCLRTPKILIDDDVKNFYKEVTAKEFGCVGDYKEWYGKYPLDVNVENNKFIVVKCSYCGHAYRLRLKDSSDN